MQALSLQSHFHVPVSRLPVGEADRKRHYDGSATI